jgi:hypothetical protein
MAGEGAGTPGTGGYVVLREAGDGHWEIIGDVNRRPGLTARSSRVQAVKDAIGREPAEGEAYAALPRSEWRVARQPQGRAGRSGHAGSCPGWYFARGPRDRTAAPNAR